MDGDGKEHKLLNENVLIEIGAAMALYGRKFIMLVEQGATRRRTFRASTRCDTPGRSWTTTRP